MQMKSEYRKKYETLQVEKACLKTLNQFVDKARGKLLAEFDEWYRICYIGGEPIDSAICEDTDEDSDQCKKVRVRHRRRTLGTGAGVFPSFLSTHLKFFPWRPAHK